MASGGEAVRVVSSQNTDLTGVQTLVGNEASVCMLLYLNAKTWIKERDVLERDVRAARAAAGAANAGRFSGFRRGGFVQMGRSRPSGDEKKIKVILLHENDPAKGGCEFKTFFGTTPQALVDGDLYRCDIVSNCSPSPLCVHPTMCLLRRPLPATLPSPSTRSHTATSAWRSWQKPSGPPKQVAHWLTRPARLSSPGSPSVAIRRGG